MWFGMFLSLKIKWIDVFTALIRGMLNISLCFVGLILTIFLLREGSYMAAMLYNNTSEKSSYDLIEALVTYFLFFEFVALIVVYFKSGCHFPLRYFIYIAITAIIRLLIVDHSSAQDTILYCASIFILSTILLFTKSKKIEP